MMTRPKLSVMKWFFAALSILLLPLTAGYPKAPPLIAIEVQESLNAFARLLELFDIPADASPQQVVAETQRLWLQKGKERWEFDSRYEELRPQLWPLFEKLGLIQKIKPRKSHYDYALVHGALSSRLEERAAYLASLWRQGIRFDQIVFLSGARPLQESEKRLFPHLSTEREMAEWIYRESELPKEIPVVFVNAPMKLRADGAWARPQTGDTLFSWLSLQPKDGSCLAVSNQPYVAYQDAVARKILPPNFPLETVGSAVDSSPSVALLLDTIAKELYARFAE